MNTVVKKNAVATSTNKKKDNGHSYLTPMEPFHIPYSNRYLIDTNHPDWKNQASSIKNM